MAPFREWHFTDHCKCSWHSPSCHFAMRQNSFPIQFKLISLYFKLTSLEFNKYNIRNLWMEQNLISSLMDRTLKLLRNLPCQYAMWKYCVFPPCVLVLSIWHDDRTDEMQNIDKIKRIYKYSRGSRHGLRF